jgi:hypothetical protein
MYEAKTKPTVASVAAYLDAIEDESRRKDCKELAELMKRVSGCVPKMWGTSIVGFDQYHYRYDSGHEGDSCIVGFSSRKSDISLYLVCGFDALDDLLTQLGKHKIGKACLYIKRLSDIELPVLERMVERALAETKRRYPAAKDAS